MLNRCVSQSIPCQNNGKDLFRTSCGLFSLSQSLLVCILGVWYGKVLLPSGGATARGFRSMKGNSSPAVHIRDECSKAV